MANKKGISTALKRQLRSGKEYHKLMPTVKCERTPLGEGDTFFTVDAMKAWVEQYAGQTAKLAPVLVGRDLEETVNNIYAFLYSHIQYEADGALQQLRSPACTWVQRKEGVDCKSFSVFASAILSNLGIKHFIRQIRQPYFYPEEFTHVYVVVPKNQNDIDNSATFVLDATKHQNVESDYIEKVDLKMTKLQHIGLNAPQDERTKRIVENFERFNRFLLDKGVPVATVNAIRERISSFTGKGKDPKFEITHDGLVIEGISFPLQFNQHVPYLAVKQAFSGGLKGTSPASFFKAFEGENLLRQINENTNQINGLNAGIVTAGVEVASSLFNDIVGGIVEDLSTNISNVLKYGFSSWGASSTPEEMKKRFGERAYPWLQNQLANITPQNLESTLNLVDFTLRVNMMYFRLLRDEHSRAESTRLANDWATKECERLLQESIAGISAKLEAEGVTVTQARARSISDLPASTSYYFWKDAQLQHGDGWTYNDMVKYKVDQTSLSLWQKAKNLATGGSTNPDISGGYQQPTSGGSNYQQPQTGGTGNVNDVPQEKSGSNTGLILGGIALAAAPFFFMKKGAISGALKSKKK